MSTTYLYPPVDQHTAQTPSPLPLWARVLYIVLTVIFGFFYGSLGSVQHQVNITLGEIDLPLGLCVALLGYIAIVSLFRLLYPGIGRVLQFCAGALLALALYSTQSAGGTVLIPNNTYGWIWLVGTVLISAIALLWPRSHRVESIPTATGSVIEQR
ncbi:hypothetical protein [Lysinibacter sp. HNR]|uniref:hypothetical protein n=1 Tax=Lysinibacter sp. HNR TaxID=3031408 RepID=UPI0024349DC6|nr:hypothetical protein [Lysinibacter sp. HNR]WGD38363.1 hypothetical protein FrondiHNR_05480 [Lysinibacter sp. HNR]